MTTNIHNYFFNGMKAVPDVYQYDKLPANNKNDVRAFQASHLFEGNIGQTAILGNNQMVIVDNAVQIQTVQNHVRQAALVEMNRLKEQSKKTFVATLITGIVATVAGVAAGIAAFTFPPLVIAAVPVFLLGVSLLIVAGRSHSNMEKAQVELDKWRDPVEVAIEHRRMAKRQGFFYIHTNNLKNTHFHPDEVKRLWYHEVEKYIEQYKKEDEFVLKSDARSIRAFFDRNPLQKSAVNYAFEQDVPGDVEDLSKSFVLLENRYQTLRQETEQQKRAIQDAQQKAIGNLVTERDRLLRPIETNYRIRDQDLRRRISKLMPNPRNPVGGNQQTLLMALNTQIIKNSQNYQAIRGPIDTWYSKEERKINAWAIEELKEIQKSEDNELLKFHPPMQKLLERYGTLSEVAAVKPSAPLYKDIEESMNNVYPQPSAPKLEELELDHSYNAYTQPPAN